MLIHLCRLCDQTPVKRTICPASASLSARWSANLARATSTECLPLPAPASTSNDDSPVPPPPRLEAIKRRRFYLRKSRHVFVHGISIRLDYAAAADFPRYPVTVPDTTPYLATVSKPSRRGKGGKRLANFVFQPRTRSRVSHWFSPVRSLGHHHAPIALVMPARRHSYHLLQRRQCASR